MDQLSELFIFSYLIFVDFVKCVNLTFCGLRTASLAFKCRTVCNSHTVTHFSFWASYIAIYSVTHLTINTTYTLGLKCPLFREEPRRV